MNNQTILDFIANVELFCQDYLYGTSNCSMTLDALWAQMLLILCLSNNCLTLTQAQQQCFNSLLTQKLC